MAQAGAVRAALVRAWERGPVSLVPVVTAGDRSQSRDDLLPEGRGAFVRELDRALVRGDVDVCVHSAKDVPSELAPGLAWAGCPPRGDARDALAGGPYRSLGEVPPGSTLATGSPRRVAQLRALRPDLRFAPIRGNVDSRLDRVGGSGFAAAVLAVAGLVRVGRAAEIREVWSTDLVVPAAGQGALFLVARAEDAPVLSVLAALCDPVTTWAVAAERAVLSTLGGGCDLPVGVYAAPTAAGWSLSSVLANTDGGLVGVHVRTPSADTDLDSAVALGQRCAAALVAGLGKER